MVRKCVNGRNFANHLGEQVILLGTISKKSSDGTSVEIITTDGIRVDATLSNPIDENAEGYIELHGIVNTSSTMLCSEYILFPSSMTEHFDTHEYSKCLDSLTMMGIKWWDPEGEEEDD